MIACITCATTLILIAKIAVAVVAIGGPVALWAYTLKLFRKKCPKCGGRLKKKECPISSPCNHTHQCARCFSWFTDEELRKVGR